MSLSTEFRQFIGSHAWGRSGFHRPTDQQTESNSFELPVKDGLLGTIHQTHLDLLNIGHNSDSFNRLSPDVKELAESAADSGNFSSLQAAGQQGQLALTHMTNVANAQRHLLATLLGPMGVALSDFTTELSQNVPAAKGELVSLGVHAASETFITGDVYAVTQRDYRGAPLNGVSGRPIARVSVDLSSGQAYRWPEEYVGP